MIVWLFYSILFVAVAAFWIIFGAGSQLSMHVVVVVLLCRRRLFPLFFSKLHTVTNTSQKCPFWEKRSQGKFSFYYLVLRNFRCVYKSYFIIYVSKRGSGALCIQLWPRGTFCAEKWRTFFRLNCLRIRATATFLI